LYSVNPIGFENHDAVMRIGGKLLGGGSNLRQRHNGQGGHRRTATSDRSGRSTGTADGRRT
jgi:hypothetical protein